MIAFFEGLWQIITRLLNTLFNIMDSIENIIDFLTTAIKFPITISGYVPAVILTSIYITLVIGIIKTILGWGNS